MQLSLFLESAESTVIEQIRSMYNPIQFELIPSHITLCREDEIENIEHVIQNLETQKLKRLCLTLGNLVRFDDGKGVYIEIIDEQHQFQELRKKVLQGIIDHPRDHKPHLTIMHPRNSTCDDNIYQALLQHELPSMITINKITLIEQEIGKKWMIKREFPLET